MATKKTSVKKATTKKSTAKKSNNSRSMAAKGYVKAPKETKVEEVKVTQAKREKEIKEEVKALINEDVKPVKKTSDAKKICSNFITVIRENLVVILAVVVIIVLAVLLLKVVSRKTNQSTLEKNFELIGRRFYEEYYYNGTGKDEKARVKFLSNFKDTGLRINLDNLMRYEFTDEKGNKYEFVNKKTKDECDKTESVIVIYPQEPYGKTDYVIDAKLSCGFEK